MTEPNDPSKTHRLFPLVLVAAACCVAACGSSDNSSESKTNDASAAASAHASSASTAVIDACALIPAADITALLGTSVPGKPTSTTPGTGACMWENQDTYESVTLEIGSPGTAPNNTLPSTDPGFPDGSTPGPDGMRYLGSRQVEFPAGNRSNTVQVAVLKISSDEANAAAVDLARKVGPKVPS